MKLASHCFDHDGDPCFSPCWEKGLQALPSAMLAGTAAVCSFEVHHREHDSARDGQPATNDADLGDDISFGMVSASSRFVLLQAPRIARP